MSSIASKSLRVPAERSGWIRKLARTSIRKNWKRRYLVVSHGALKYYVKKLEHTTNDGSNLKGGLDLANTDIVHTGLGGERQILVKAYDGSQNMLMELEPGEDKEAWIKTIEAHRNFADQCAVVSYGTDEPLGDGDDDDDLSDTVCASEFEFEEFESTSGVEEFFLHMQAGVSRLRQDWKEALWEWTKRTFTCMFAFITNLNKGQRGERGEKYVVVIITLTCFTMFGGSLFMQLLLQSLLRVGGLLLLLLAAVGAGSSLVSLGPNSSFFLVPVTDSTVVHSGPYSLVRHPLYGCLVLGCLGWAAMRGSVEKLGLALLLAVVLDHLGGLEEKYLTDLHPLQYQRMMTDKKRLVPFLY